MQHGVQALKVNLHLVHFSILWPFSQPFLSVCHAPGTGRKRLTMSMALRFAGIWDLEFSEIWGSSTSVPSFYR